MPTKLTRLEINRVDLVDDGANQGAHIVLFKRNDGEPYWLRDFSADERRAAAGRGQAMSDGSFPIISEGDLRNAVQAVGRAGNPGAAKAHIIRRARALGRSDLLPDSWVGKSLVEVSSTLAELWERYGQRRLAELERRVSAESRGGD